MKITSKVWDLKQLIIERSTDIAERINMCEEYIDQDRPSEGRIRDEKESVYDDIVKILKGE